jgi:SRSO17 transposase
VEKAMQIDIDTIEKKFQFKGALKEFPSVTLQQVYGSRLEPVWNELVQRYHYLGHKNLLGKRLKYLAFIEDCPVAALSWSAPAKRLEARDKFIGWSDDLRQRSLYIIAANSRFVIFPWVQIPNFGSYILGMNLRCLRKDWVEQFHDELLLVETFVDPSFFQGTVYKASNWKKLGKTKGYTKCGKGYVYHGQIKEIYIYILNPHYREILGVPSTHFPEHRLSKKVEETSLSLQQSEWIPASLEEFEMTEEDFDSIAQELTEFHNIFSDCFSRSEQESLGLTYLSGLMSGIERKTAERIALELKTPQSVRSTQRFLKTYQWDHKAMLQQHQQLVIQAFATEEGMITVDSSEIPKKGKQSVGVAYQYCGNTGKKDNCQSGVFVGYVSEKGYGLIDTQLYMPESWFDNEHEDLRKINLVPEKLSFQKKNDIASALIKSASAQFPARWIGCDAGFGSDMNFLNSLPDSLYYFADIKSDSKVFLEKPEVGIPPYSGRGKRPTKPRVLSNDKPISVSKLGKSDELKWQYVNLGEGSKGPLLAQVACIRVFPSRDGLPQDDPVWLIIRKRTDGQIRYAFSNAPETISFEELCHASCLRWSIERCFQEGKMHLGMDHYEHRSWPAWHRHMIYVMLAQHFLFRVRERLKKKILSLPMAKKLLQTVLPIRSLTRKGALSIVKYYLKRNDKAHQSHRKKQIIIAQNLGIQVSL